MSSHDDAVHTQGVRQAVGTCEACGGTLWAYVVWYGSAPPPLASCAQCRASVRESAPTNINTITSVYGER